MYRGRNKKTSKIKSTSGEYKGLPYDSLEELAFLQWCFELKGMGYIASIKRGKSYLLSDALIKNHAVKLKTKSKPATQVLLHGHTYSPDFELVWTELGVNTFVDLLNKDGKILAPLIVVNNTSAVELNTVVEIKPVWGANPMERLFKLNQKWMWDKLGIFVNLVKPAELFKKTFTPAAHITTATGKLRKLGYKPRTLNEYLQKSTV